MEQNATAYHIVQRSVPTMYFIGVTTGQSMMMRIFPQWASMLDLHQAQLIGVDLPLQAPSEQYQQAVAQIKYDPLSLGGLITSHKIDVMNAAKDMFGAFDEHAQLCREVTCIIKRDGQLIASARDTVNAQLALLEILGERYWSKSGGYVLCLGAGGAGTALTVNLLTQADPTNRPPRLIVVNDHQRGLDRLRSIVDQAYQQGPTRDRPVSPVEVDYTLNEDPRKNDELMAALPPGSLIINATGMGKDRPGSPITDAAIFPLNGIVWELNYRGKLDFLHQARTQQAARNLNVHDGWHYFVVSWADHIAAVFNITITPAQLSRLAAKADELRT